MRNKFDPKTQQTSQSASKHSSRLTELREEAGFTQVELAALLGVSPTTIQSWEKSGLPHLQKYYKLAQILDRDLTEIEEPEEESSHKKLLELIRAQKASKIKTAR